MRLRKKPAEQIQATANALLQAKGPQLKVDVVMDATRIAKPPPKTETASATPRCTNFGMKAHIEVGVGSSPMYIWNPKGFWSGT